MKPRVYLETSVISYLTARPSRDLIAAAHQSLTAEWWDRRRSDFELVISEVVIDEARKGDPKAARRRLDVLRDVATLRVTEISKQVAKTIMLEARLPATAFLDALHIAVAADHSVDFLLTWNCRHIANAEIFPTIGRICRRFRLETPSICTPEELLGGTHVN